MRIVQRAIPHGGAGIPLCNQEIFWFGPVIQVSVTPFFPNITWPLGWISNVMPELLVGLMLKLSDFDTFLLCRPVPISLTPKV